MADKVDSLRALDDDDSLTIQTERSFAENIGNEGCGDDSARGSNCLPDGTERGVGNDLAEAIEEAVQKVTNKVKDAVGLHAKHDHKP